MYLAPSDVVRDFQFVRNEPKVGEAYNVTSSLLWKLPCRQNGKIVKFIVECRNLDFPDQHLNYEVFVTHNEEHYNLATDDLLPDSRYNISIKSVAQDFQGKEVFKEVLIEAGCKHLLYRLKFLVHTFHCIILVPDLSSWKSTEIKSDPSTKIAKLTIPTSIFESKVGEVVKVLLLIAELVSFLTFILT